MDYFCAYFRQTNIVLIKYFRLVLEVIPFSQNFNWLQEYFYAVYHYGLLSLLILVEFHLVYASYFYDIQGPDFPHLDHLFK